MAEAGLETVANSPQKTGNSSRGGAESGAVDARSGAFDPELQTIVDAWPSLPDTVKAGILAMVKSAIKD